MQKVLLIEDNEPLNEVYCEMIDRSEGFTVVGSYLNCEEALISIKDLSPDIVLMDIELPGMDGIQGTKEIKKKMPQVKIIMITVYENSRNVFDALCAGAIGYLTKNTSSDTLIRSLKEAASGGAPMSIKIAKMVVESFKKAPQSILTERETQVITMLSQGSSYKSIAIKLDISVNTIKYHIKNIYDKLQVHSKEDAIQEASKRNLI